MNEETNMTFCGLTHYDLDAGASMILAHHRWPIQCYRGQGYGKVDKSIDWLIGTGHQVLVVTDLCLELYQMEKCLEHFAQVIYVDHHEGSEQFVDWVHPNLVVHFTKEKSAAGIMLDLLEEADMMTPELFNLGNVTDTYDMWKTDNKLWERAYDLNTLFWHHGMWDFFDIFKEGIKEVSNYGEAEEQICLAKREEVARGMEEVEIITISEDIGMFVLQDRSLCGDITLQNQDYKFYLITYPGDGGYGMSMRLRDDDQNDLNLMAETVVEKLGADGFIKSAGGHKKAAGVSFKPGATWDDVCTWTEMVCGEYI